MSDDNFTVKLFSYGTLQFESVQLATFNRKLSGSRDILNGYALSELTIKDPDVLDKSATAVHPIIRYTGDAKDSVSGCILLISEKELAQADSYEVDDYKRVQVTLSSGAEAWAYVAADSK